MDYESDISKNVITINGSITINMETGDVCDRSTGNCEKLKPTGRSLFDYLFQNREHWLSSNQIFDFVWKNNVDVDTTVVKNQIANIRKVFTAVCGKKMANSLIVNDRGSSNSPGRYMLKLTGPHIKSLQLPNENDITTHTPAVSLSTVRCLPLSTDTDWKDALYSSQKHAILDMSAMPWLGHGNAPNFQLVIPAMLVNGYLQYNSGASGSVSQTEFIETCPLRTNLAIIGSAGSGKSTLLFLLYLRQTTINSSELNIFADPRWFQSYDGSPIEQFLLRRAGFPGFSLESYGFIRIFIDGFDEVDEETGQTILEIIEENRIEKTFIVSCREHEYEEIILNNKRWHRLFEDSVMIGSWSVELSNSYVKKAAKQLGISGEKSESFINTYSSDRSFAEIYSNPFQLNILMYLYFMDSSQQGQISSSNLFFLYDRFIHAIFLTEARRGSTKCTYIEFLETSIFIAKEIFRETNEGRNSIIKQTGYRFQNVFLRHEGMFLKSNSVFPALLYFNQDSDIVKFRHETIYEYFLAKSFLLALQDRNLDRIIEEFDNFYDFYINKFVRSGIAAYETNSESYYNSLASLYRECLRAFPDLLDRFDKDVSDYLTNMGGHLTRKKNLPKDTSTLRELSVYYTGRLSMKQTPCLLRFAASFDPEPVIQRTSYLGLMLHNDEDAEYQYISSLMPNTPSDIMQRSLTLLYFGDDFGNIYSYKDPGDVSWENSKKEIIERLKWDNKRNLLFRMWDLRTLYLFCESRGTYKFFTDDELDVIKNCNVNSQLYSEQKKILISQEKERILKKIREETK